MTKKGQFIDWTGRRVGCVRVLGINKNVKGVYYWDCICDCGEPRIIRGNNLGQMITAKSKSCRCAQRKSNWLIDWIGKRSGMLTVIEAKSKTGKGMLLRCLCACGNIKDNVSAYTFKKGSVKSCGCSTRKFYAEANITHGQTKTPEYQMWNRVKHRAKTKKMLFDLDWEDIHIPSRCPLLGIPLEVNNQTPKANSPSLDKIIPELGYVKGNVWVVSQRANQIKNNATVEELREVANNLEKKLSEMRESLCQTTTA